jgi:heat shock protein 4
VTIASFIKGNMRIVIHKSDRNLGARNMDALLVEKLGEEFAKKVGSDPRKNVRCRLRMLDVIEKQRKILTGNKEATIHLESLLEDEDLHKNIKREEFEELIQPMIEKFTALMQEALNESGKNLLENKARKELKLSLYYERLHSYPCDISRDVS